MVVHTPNAFANGNGGRGSNSTFSTITSTGGGKELQPSGTGVTTWHARGSGGGAGNDTTGSSSYGTGNTPPVSPSQETQVASGVMMDLMIETVQVAEEESQPKYSGCS